MTVRFTQKLEKLPNFTNKTPKTPPPIVVTPTNNVAHVYTIPQTYGDSVLLLPTTTTAASSSHPPVAENTKDTNFYTLFFESQPYTESLVRITIRDWQGFCNPQGSQVGVARGTGRGWKLCTLEKPLPAVQVAGFWRVFWRV